MENEVLKAIKERRSIRRFKADQITDEELKTVLEAGTWGSNRPWHSGAFIIAVQNPEVCAQLRKMNAEIMGVESDPYYGAPTIVIVLAPESNVNGVKDGSLILGNMMLAAHSIGLSSCWINREDGMFASEEGKKLMKDWNLPEGLMGVRCLGIGLRISSSSYRKASQGGLLPYHQIGKISIKHNYGRNKSYTVTNKKVSWIFKTMRPFFYMYYI